MLTFAYLLGTKIVATEENFTISEQSYDKIHSNEFDVQKKSFAESPSLFMGKSNFDIPQAIAFDEKIRLTPGDIIKISEELTFSDWGKTSLYEQVAAEDFTLPKDKKINPDDDGDARAKKFQLQNK